MATTTPTMSQQQRRDGLRRLRKASRDRDHLESAIVTLHAAIETEVRDLLAFCPDVPPELQRLAADPRKTTWRDLLDMLKRYIKLCGDIRQEMAYWTDIRNQVAHGGRFGGSLADVSGLVRLVNIIVPPEPGVWVRAYAVAGRFVRGVVHRATTVLAIALMTFAWLGQFIGYESLGSLSVVFLVFPAMLLALLVRRRVRESFEDGWLIRPTTCVVQFGLFTVVFILGFFVLFAVSNRLAAQPTGGV